MNHVDAISEVTTGGAINRLMMYGSFRLTEVKSRIVIHTLFEFFE